MHTAYRQHRLGRLMQLLDAFAGNCLSGLLQVMLILCCFRRLGKDTRHCHLCLCLLCKRGHEGSRHVCRVLPVLVAAVHCIFLFRILQIPPATAPPQPALVAPWSMVQSSMGSPVASHTRHPAFAFID